MYTFELTICALIAVFGFAGIVCDILLNRYCDIEDEVTEYGKE